MPEAVIHPTPQELTAFGLGKLPEGAAAAIAAHLESCAACRQAVAGVSADSFLDKVRAARQDDASFPPSLAQPPDAPSSAGRPAVSIVPCPDVPPELARHPKYLILRELGRGGMGVVYQARQTVMNRQVVIKVVNPTLVDRPESLERFRREIQAAAQLSHPNIVTAYDAEQVGGLHMLVMEFVPGRSLADVVHLKGALPISVACYFARQVALGLQHAYERGMVHRDIKPQNLMMTPQGQVKILDFGLAKVIREHVTGKGLTSTDAYMGTPEYCAPEQAKDASKADIRADLYSLGCTLYCLLAGNPPFREDTWMNTALAHIQKPPQPLPELRPEVPAELWQVVARLLAKEPDQRYEKPVEAAQALFPFTKSATKRDVKNILAPGPEVSSPPKGTVIAADTGEIKKILRAVPGKTPPKAVPAKGEAVSPFADLADMGSASENIVRVSEAAKPYLARWWKRPGVVATALSISLALILMAVIIIKVKVQTPNEGTGKVMSSKSGTDKPKPSPTEAIVVLEIDQPGAEVSVDGQNIKVNVPGDNEPIEIKVEPGQHKLRISKAGFEAVTQNIELKTGKSPPVKIRLEPEPPKPGDKGDEKWIQDVVAMPAEAQVKAVAAKLKERNPGFDGAVTPTIEHGVVTRLWFVTDEVTNISSLRALPGLKHLTCRGSGEQKGKLADLSPLKGMQLTTLECWNNRISDLSPLKGMPLVRLACYNYPVADDLSPLRGMPLKALHIWGWRGRDLSPLKGMSLFQLNCGGGGMVEDLSPLADMPLRFLCVNSTKVSDLSPLKGMRLNSLMVSNTRVSDLSLLKGMPLRVLFIVGSLVTDLTPIRELPLTELICNFQPERDTEILRSITTLAKINDKPAAQFWKEVDDKKKDEEKWIREVRALPAEQQIKRVVAKLKERNPGFDGKVELPTIENGVVTGLEFVTDHVTDIRPLRALPGLKLLSCAGSAHDKGKLADLSPLKGMHLTELICYGNNRISELSPLKGMQLKVLSCIGTSASDLSPLKGMPLRWLTCGDTQVSDLSPLKDMPLTKFGCANTQVSDLSPLKGMRLTRLVCYGTAISDLSPLKGMPLEELYCEGTRVSDLSMLKDMPLKKLNCDFLPERDTEILRSIKTLEEIKGKPVEQFWKEVGEPKRKATDKPQVNLPADASVDDLRKALKHEAPSVRETAAARLANLGPKARPALDALAEAMNDANNPVSVRRNAALAIANMRAEAKPIVPALAKALQSSHPQEVRMFAAEALHRIQYPANEKGIPAILDAIEKDTDAAVRNQCIEALSEMDRPKFKESGAEKLLTKVLNEHDKKMEMVRYIAARKLAQILRDEAPDKTADVLLEWLTNTSYLIYNGTDAKEEGGRTKLQPNLGGDARFLAAQALAWLGNKAAKRADVVEALRKAAKDKDEKPKEAAQNALKELKIEE